MKGNQETTNQDPNQTTSQGQSDNDVNNVNLANEEGGIDPGQSEIIAEFMGATEDGETEQAGEGKPAKAESDKGQPNGAEATSTEGNEATQPGTGETQTKSEESDKGAAEDQAGQQEQSGKSQEIVQADLDSVVEVTTVDGVRSVPVKNLVTTYTQHRYLQGLHEQIKPMFDLAKQTGVNPGDLFGYVRLGIESAKAMQDGKPAPGSQGQQKPINGSGANSDGYDGPFKDQAEDDKMKEIDPTMYNTTVMLHNRNQQLESSFHQLNQRIDGMANTSQSENVQRQHQAAATNFQTTMDEFVKHHPDYFKADPATGVSENMQLFRQHLATYYGDMRVEDISPEMLTIVLQKFAPNYYENFQASLAKKKQDEFLAQQQTTFGETSGTRAGTPDGQLDEQQEIMAGLV